MCNYYTIDDYKIKYELDYKEILNIFRIDIVKVKFFKVLKLFNIKTQRYYSDSTKYAQFDHVCYDLKRIMSIIRKGHGRLTKEYIKFNRIL